MRFFDLMDEMAKIEGLDLSTKEKATMQTELLKSEGKTKKDFASMVDIASKYEKSFFPEGDEEEMDMADYAKGILRKVAQGITYGTADEMEAFLGSVFGDDDKSYSQRHSEIGASNDAFEKGNPGTAITSEVLGAVGGAFTPGGIAGGITKLAGKGVSKLGVEGLKKKILTDAASGSIQAGIYGLGAGDGLKDRLLTGGEAMATGGLMSGGMSSIGSALPHAGRALQGALSKGSGGKIPPPKPPPAPPSMGPEEFSKSVPALLAVKKTLKKEGIDVNNPEDIQKVQGLLDNYTKTGKGDIVDLATIGKEQGPIRREAHGLLLREEGISGKFVEEVSKRQEGTLLRAIDDVKDISKGKFTSVSDAREAMSKVKKTEAGTNYNMAYYGAPSKTEKVVPLKIPNLSVSKIEKQYGSIIPVKKALKVTKGFTNAKGKDASKFKGSLEELNDLVKRLDDQTTSLFRKGQEATAFDVAEIRDSILDAMKVSSKDYAKARNIYAGHSASGRAYEMGLKYMGSSLDNRAKIQTLVKKMSDDEFNNFQFALVADAVDGLKKAGKNSFWVNAKTRMTGQSEGNIMEDFVDYATRGKAPSVKEKFVNAAQQEGEMLSASTELLRGSKTGKALEDIMKGADTEKNLSQMLGAAVTNNQAGFMYYAVNIINSMKRGKRNIGMDKVKTDMADIYLDQGAENLKKILMELQSVRGNFAPRSGLLGPMVTE